MLGPNANAPHLEIISKYKGCVSHCCSPAHRTPDFHYTHIHTQRRCWCIDTSLQRSRHEEDFGV